MISVTGLTKRYRDIPDSAAQAGVLLDARARPGTLVKGFDAQELAGALAAAGFEVSWAGDGWLRAQATADEVGRAATRAGLALAALRDVDSCGIDELYLEPIAQARRDDRFADEHSHDRYGRSGAER
jgi:hypothetical protein